MSKSLCLLIRKYKETGTVADKKRPKRDVKLTIEHYNFIDENMVENSELSAPRLHRLLRQAFPNLVVSQSTVKRARRELGWVAKKTCYCALISEKNQQKRLDWCLERQRTNDTEFKDVIWSDECTIQLESHRRITFHKKGHLVTYRMKPKHSPKLHIWAGISYEGATNVVIFTGTMNAVRYVEILKAGLLPFLVSHYPNGHRFQQDNDPKHTSRYARWFYEQENINWFKTPPSSPDLNPIEMLWHTVKEYLRVDYKPRNLMQLRMGIKEFWSTITPETCRKYIGHLKKVIPKVIEVKGGPSGH